MKKSTLAKTGAIAGIVGALSLFGGVAYLACNGKTLSENLVAYYAYRGVEVGYHTDVSSASPAVLVDPKDRDLVRKRMDRVLEDKQSVAVLGPSLVQRLKDYKAHPTLDQRKALLADLMTLRKEKKERPLGCACTSIVVGLAGLVTGATVCTVAAWS